MALTIYRYRCPYCTDGYMGDAVGRCLECHGTGTITEEQAGNLPREELVPLPVPPGVNTRACADCAYRVGSPELEGNGETLPADGPFWCHLGMDVSYDGSYVPAGYVTGPNGEQFPIGAQICAGWWALQTGRPLPKGEFRETPVKKKARQP